MPDTSDKPIVNFAVLQNVEDYAEKSGKFRTKCSSFNIPGRDSGSAKGVYVPYCEKQRFDFGHELNEYRAHGAFTPPETGKSWPMTDFILFREHFHDIHCPQPCRGYRNKRVVALFEKLWPRTRIAGTGAPEAGKWTRKEIVILVVTVVVSLVGAILGWVTPEGRRFLQLDKPQAEQHIPTTSVPQPKTEPKVEPGPTKPPNAGEEKHGTTDKATAVVKPSSTVDWHDKHNWRKYLHTGMTRTDVRKMFGDPEKMRVIDTLETWDYGSGSITFVVERGTPDGDLYSWDEPD